MDVCRNGLKIFCGMGLSLIVAVAPVSAADEVNVYSYRQPFLIKPIFDGFTRKTGIKVNTVYAQKGLVERLTSEGVNSPADLIFTVDISRLSAAVDAGVTQPVDSAILQKHIPEEFRDSDNHWFGLTTRARIIVYSNERMQPGDIDSYADLADPKFAGKLCTRSGKHDYMLGLIASQIAHHGEQATQTWLEGVKSNLARKPQGNERAQVKAISEGECDIAVINSYYMGNMQTNEEQFAWASAVDVVFPDQDGNGTHLNISGVALTKAAPNKANAVMLMEYLTDNLAQKIYAEQNHEYPVNVDVEPSGLVQSWGEFKHDTLLLSKVVAARTAASKMVDVVGYDN